jgi:acyl-homoserine lactone acylase PvdQ
VSWEPWKPVDTLSILRVASFNLSFGWQGPVLRSWLRDVMGDVAADEWQEPVCSIDKVCPAGNRSTVPPEKEMPHVGLYESALPKLADPGNIPALVGSAIGLNPLGAESTGNGSNFYGVHGRYTASGGALLAAGERSSACV